MNKSKYHQIADLFREQPINRMSPCIGSGGSVIGIVIDIIVIAMLIGIVFILWK